MIQAPDEYISVEDAANILRLGVRMVNRYSNPPNSRLRTHKVSRLTHLQREDDQGHRLTSWNIR
jgi:hypothetical protein